MTKAALTQLLAPLPESATVFLETEDSDEIVELHSVEVDDEGDIILSDSEEEDEREEDEK